MRNKLVVVSGVLIVLAAWQVLSMTGLPFIPSPRVVLKILFSHVFWLEILPDFWATLGKVLMAVSGATLVGVSLGLLMGYFAFVYRLLTLPVDFFRALPATALFPLFMLLFGIGILSKMILIIFSCSLVMIVSTASGVRQGLLLRRMAAKTMGASKLQIFTRVIFFDALPQIFTGIKVILSMSILLVVVFGMFIGTKAGLGKRLYDFHLTYQISYMYAVIILIGLMSGVLNMFCLFVEKRVVHWVGK